MKNAFALSNSKAITSNLRLYEKLVTHQKFVIPIALDLLSKSELVRQIVMTLTKMHHMTRYGQKLLILKADNIVNCIFTEFP